MSSSLSVNILVEGDLDEAVLKKVLDFVDIEVTNVYGRRGKNYLKENVGRFNQAARHGKWVLLVDLNKDAECPPPLIASWLPARHPNLQFRVAVRAIEAWLLAERKEMARFLAVSPQRIPMVPEEEQRPKNTLIDLARYSKSRSIRSDIVPPEGSSASQGKLYTTRLIEFALRYWNPRRAAANSPSLKRSLDSLLCWKSEICR